MIRLVIYVLLSLAIAGLAAFVISLPGTITIEAMGYRMQPGLGTATLALILFVILCLVSWAIIRRLIDAPNRMARAAKARRKQQGVDALTDGFIALEAGDVKNAKSLAQQAQSRLPGNAAAKLLEARAELALGELGPAREHYRALISDPKTALAALAGLYDQAKAQSRPDIALTFAQKAIKLGSEVKWAETALFDDLVGKGAWADALNMVAGQSASSKEARAAKKRKQAVLNTALAQSHEDTDPNTALSYALTALKLAPECVPAALIAARVHSSRGEPRKAQSLLRRLWRQTGHPHIALLFINAQSGASALERLKRARDIIGAEPADSAAAQVLARAAIDAYEWKTARACLAPYLKSKPSQGVCMLMAEIEEGESGDQGKAREWLSKGLRAPRDPAWVADGITSEDWEPVSPVSGKLDAFEWKVPQVLEHNRKLPATSGAPAAKPLPAPAVPETKP